MEYEPLTAREIASVIEGRSVASRVPSYIHFWVHPDAFGDRKDAVLGIMNRYPMDIQLNSFWMPSAFRNQNPQAAEFSWLPWEEPKQREQRGIDAAVALESWDRLDEVLENFPDPNSPHVLKPFREPDGRYRLAQWFFCLFERHWSLRGMTNALLDYYTNPNEVHRLFRALTDFYVGIIERSARESRCDGLWTSDDLGTQTAPFFSLGIFREFYRPYYRDIFAACRRNGMHAWMHACGDVELFITDWMDIGLDVLHPIQKHCMDEREIARKYGDRLTVFAGLDVQQVIPWGTPEEVRQEVRFLIDTYWRPGEGRCMITAGNGINGDCPLASLEAFFDEAFRYGRAKVSG